MYLVHQELSKDEKKKKKKNFFWLNEPQRDGNDIFLKDVFILVDKSLLMLLADNTNGKYWK